jgi:hypothetical protein
MARDAAQSYTPAAYFGEEQHVVGHQTSPRQHLHRKKVGTASTSICDWMNSFHVVMRLRFGAGAILCRRRMFPTVWSELPRPPAFSSLGWSNVESASVFCYITVAR